MPNRIQNLLKHWLANRHQCRWILGTLVRVEGSAYRKPGAMMLMNDLGQYFGLLSGGCLESDILMQSRKCVLSETNRVVHYDFREEDDVSTAFGIGCRGKISILLQPILASNNDLHLEDLLRDLALQKHCQYEQNLDEVAADNHLRTIDSSSDIPRVNAFSKSNKNNRTFTQVISPAPHILVFGGGPDARPLVSMANQLGWRVSLWDCRVNYARKCDFPTADTIYSEPLTDVDKCTWVDHIDVAILMTHNLQMDAMALAQCQTSDAGYVGLLGPAERTEQVLKSAGLHWQTLLKPLINPVGLPISDDLPESIALAILAEAQAYMTKSHLSPLVSTDVEPLVLHGH